MKFNTQHMGLSLLGLLFLSSCSDWLNVQPNDKFTETQVFSTETGTQTALNGIYMQLVDPSIYGREMTMGTLEVLGQQFNAAQNATFNLMNQYNFTNEVAKNGKFDKMWTKSYSTILDINNLLLGIQANPGVLSDSHSRWIRGEALGLRAFIHFDLLRIFGTVPTSEGMSSNTIPYYNSVSGTGERLPMRDVLQYILTDLDSAASLLRDDPVFDGQNPNSIGGSHGSNNNPFYYKRNSRFNYFAVRALQARVNMYAGNTSLAAEFAQKVIDEGSTLFPWTDPQAATNGSHPDRIFSSEVLFGPQCTKLYNTVGYASSYFGSALSSTAILRPEDGHWELYFVNAAGDYRSGIRNWDASTSALNDYPHILTKYIAASDSNSKYMIPLIRISEMYYILAEVAANHANYSEASTLLNKVQSHRNIISSISDQATFDTELEYEYRREFFGEGQVFFFFKRRNAPFINDGSSTNINTKIPMTATEYTVDIPASEKIN